MGYDNLVIDPPWNQNKILRKCRPNQKKELDYATLSVEEIFDLLDKEIFPLASPQHCAWLWTTEKFLRQAEDEMLKRGYKIHVRFVWDKTNGAAPNFTIRYCHEYLLWCYKSPMMPIAKEARGKFRSLFREKSRQHSRKPDFAYHMIEKLYPDGEKIDVFSREKRDGWDQWGDQINTF